MSSPFPTCSRQRERPGHRLLLPRHQLRCRRALGRSVVSSYWASDYRRIALHPAPATRNTRKITTKKTSRSIDAPFVGDSERPATWGLGACCHGRPSVETVARGERPETGSQGCSSIQPHTSSLDAGEGLPRHRVNVRWVTPPGVETASTSYCWSNASRPSHSRMPRPSRIGTTWRASAGAASMVRSYVKGP